MSEFPSRVPYLDNSTLLRLRENIPSSQANREALQMVERNVTHVLGHELVGVFTVVNPHSPTRKPRNPLERMLPSAQSLVGLAAGLGWEENTPALRVLSTQLFLSAEEGMHREGLTMYQRQELLDEAQRKIIDYKEETQINDQDQSRIQLLLIEYFPLRGFQKNKLRQDLKKGDTDNFWRSLQVRAQRWRPALSLDNQKGRREIFP